MLLAISVFEFDGDLGDDEVDFRSCESLSSLSIGSGFTKIHTNALCLILFQLSNLTSRLAGIVRLFLCLSFAFTSLDKTRLIKITISPKTTLLQLITLFIRIFLKSDSLLP